MAELEILVVIVRDSKNIAINIPPKRIFLIG